MRTLQTIAGIGSGLGLCLLATSGCGKAEAAAEAPRSGQIELTVYKEDFALIHEKRPVDLAQGSSHVRLDHISKQLDPTSVTFDPPRGAEVIATTYDLGVGSGQGLVQRLAGKQVELIWASNTGHEGDRLKGILEPTPDGFLIRSDGKVYVNPTGTLVAPADSEVNTTPGLSVQLSSDKGTKEDLGMSYLTRGMSWSADYVAHLDAASSTMRLECWANVTNGTGIPYRDAKITFVAGSPNRSVRQPQISYDYEKARAKSDMSGALALDSPAVPIAIGELYEYPASGPASIGVDQMNRVRMIEAKEIPIRMDYSVRLSGISPWQGQGEQPRVSAQLAMKFDNKAASGLGMPLPSGGVRIYESDGRSDRYTGADTIGDLPKDSPAELTLSKVFDVYAQPTIVKNERIDKHTIRQTVRVLLHNSKPSDVMVRVVESITPRWLFASGEKPEKLDANTTQWRVNVPANGERTFETTFELKV